MKFVRNIIVGFILLNFIGYCIFLFASNGPIPDDKQEYVGTWQSDTSPTTFVINKDGTAIWKSVNSGGEERVYSGPIGNPARAFERKKINMNVGGLFIDPAHFVVDINEVPFQAEGVWKMKAGGTSFSKIE